MTTPQSAAAPAGTVGAVVGQRNVLVIQGAADITTDWRDIETLRDGEYASRVMPARLAEYQRGDCRDASMRYTAFRLVWRTIVDRQMPNATGQRSPASGDWQTDRGRDHIVLN